MPGDLAGHKGAVGGDLGRHVVGGELEDAPDAVGLLRNPGGSFFPGQEGGAGPGGAPEDARGVGAGGHRGDVFIPLLDGHILGFVALQQGAGGGAHHVGHRRAREEEDARRAVAVDVAGLFAELAMRERVVGEGPLQPAHGVERLRFPGGRHLDDLGRQLAQQGQQVGLDLRLQLVLARLAREDHHKGQPAPADHAVADGGRHLLLVTAQDHPGGLLAKQDGVAQDLFQEGDQVIGHGC